MGIVIKQTIKGSIWTYLGVIVGFITTTYLYTEYLTPEIVGLFGILMAYAGITSRFTSLGFQGVTARMFPFFRNKEKGHNGFLFIALVVHLVGFAIFILAYYFLRGYLQESNVQKSPIFAQYMFLLIPLTIATSIFQFLDMFNKVIYDAVFGTFLQEFFQRILILISVLLYAFKIINIDQLILLFASVVCLKAFIILFFLILKGEINLHPNFAFLSKKMKKEMLDVSLFNFVGGLGTLIVFNIDKILINQHLNLANTGVYTIAFYFGSLVVMPSRSLLKISSTLIADSFKLNDIKAIKDIYYKSCLNQLIIGGFLFIGIWANIDNILAILGEDYYGSKWVIFFISIGNLIDMATGVNSHIISLSKYYRYNLPFLIILIVTAIILINVLIPVYGITGAALAVCISLFINNLIRYLFLLKKFRFQPFNLKFIIVIIFYISIFIFLRLLPQLSTYIDVMMRSIIISISTLVFLYFNPVSQEFKHIIEKALSIFEGSDKRN